MLASNIPNHQESNIKPNISNTIDNFDGVVLDYFSE